MGRRTGYWFGLALFLLISCSAPENRTDLGNLISNYSTAFDQKDFIKFSNYCSEDFLFFTLDGQKFDKAAMIPFLERILAHWENVRTTIEELEIQSDQELAIARYLATINFVSNDQQGKMVNRITAGFKKTNGVWKLFHFHMSRNYS